jgi:dsRNA-specific ribonuclease
VAEVGGQELGRGAGKTKKSAEQEAALQALDAMLDPRPDVEAPDQDAGLDAPRR